MKELQIFKSPEFGAIRAMEIENEPWFVGKDVAEALGYQKARNAISAHVDDEDKKDAPIQGDLGGIQEMTIINESGVYSLVFSSKLETAKKFKHWVTSEVLPAIRKTGGYIAGASEMTDAEIMARALEIGQRTIKAQKERIEALEAHALKARPKEIFADAVSASNTSILIGELAKLLKQNGINIGQNRLFAWMRDNDYLMKSGQSRNMPTQKSMEKDLFRIKETSIANPDGSLRTVRTTKVTGKGQQYFVNIFLQGGESRDEK